MEPLQQIDLVFFFLKSKITYGISIGYHNIWNHFKEREIPNQALLKEILVRLEQDVFITKTESEGAQPVYHITFKGLLFQGYQNASEESFRQNEWRVKIEKTTLKNAKRLNYLTLILAIGTSIAALYYLMEIADYLG